MDSKQLADLVGTGIELAGIAALIIGAALTFAKYVKYLFQGGDTSAAYRDLRRGLGKAILLGLELLVAADIIRSVAIAPSFATIGVLGMIVVIRTFLSWSLELEINGSWPWQGSRSSDAVERGDTAG
ncbi:MAG: DUF1622 domain-containing protein [Chloroflexota bacterium]|nr:DUF1622 domain-containing protein [Chloroflexota bacterium]